MPHNQLAMDPFQMEQGTCSSTPKRTTQFAVKPSRPGSKSPMLSRFKSKSSWSSESRSTRKSRSMVSESELQLLEHTIEREFRQVETLGEEELAAVTGTRDLASVRTLELQVNTLDPSASVSQLGLLLPDLRELDLTGSLLSSFRDLGTHLRSLCVLRLEGSHVCDLDGIWALSCLRELHLADNEVQDLTPLSMHDCLSVLDLRNNDVHSLVNVDQLGTCSALTNLWLAANPIEEAPNFRQVVAQNIPSLEALDGVPVTATDHERLDQTLFMHVMNMRFLSRSRDLETLAESSSLVRSIDGTPSTIITTTTAAAAAGRPPHEHPPSPDVGPTLTNDARNVEPPALRLDVSAAEATDDGTALVLASPNLPPAPLSARDGRSPVRGSFDGHQLQMPWSLERPLSARAAPREANCNANMSRLGLRMKASQAAAGTRGSLKGEALSYSSDMTHGTNNLVFAGNLASSTTRRRRAQSGNESNNSSHFGGTSSTTYSSTISTITDINNTNNNDKGTSGAVPISLSGSSHDLFSDKAMDDVLDELKRWKLALEENFADLQACKKELEGLPHPPKEPSSRSRPRMGRPERYPSRRHHSTATQRTATPPPPSPTAAMQRPSPHAQVTHRRLRNAVAFEAEEAEAKDGAVGRVSQDETQATTKNGSGLERTAQQDSKVQSGRKGAGRSASVREDCSDVSEGGGGRTAFDQVSDGSKRKFYSPRLFTKDSNPNQYEDVVDALHRVQAADDESAAKGERHARSRFGRSIDALRFAPSTTATATETTIATTGKKKPAMTTGTGAGIGTGAGRAREGTGAPASGSRVGTSIIASESEAEEVRKNRQLFAELDEFLVDLRPDTDDHADKYALG